MEEINHTLKTQGCRFLLQSSFIHQGQINILLSVFIAALSLADMLF